MNSNTIRRIICLKQKPDHKIRFQIKSPQESDVLKIFSKRYPKRDIIKSGGIHLQQKLIVFNLIYLKIPLYFL